MIQCAEYGSEAMAADVRDVRRLIHWMEAWADWQRGYRPKIGFPPRSCGLRGYGSATFDEMADEGDNKQCVIIDTAVDDLGHASQAQKAAIMRRYLAVTWRFPRGNYELLLVEAHEWLIRNLPARGFVL